MYIKGSNFPFIPASHYSSVGKVVSLCHDKVICHTVR